MILKSIYKVPNGKLIKISLEKKDNIIQNIKITGDFFIHPEDSIEKLEKILKNVFFDEKAIITRLNAFFHSENVVAIGFNPHTLTKAIILAK